MKIINLRSRTRVVSESGLTLLELVVVIGVFAIVIIGALYLFTQRITSLVAPQVTTGNAYVGTLTMPPPTAVTAPVQVVYTGVQRRFKITGGGQPTIVGTPMPYQGATVTFGLSTGNATIAGATQVNVPTDANGNDEATLAPVRDGIDELTVIVTIGTADDTEDPVRFEVDAP